MLVDLQVLEHYKTTKQRIRELFTAKEGSEDWEYRKQWEDRLQSRIQEGALWCLKNYNFFAAADLAWDTNIITKELVPLSLYAQGKIDFKELLPQIKALPVETQNKFVKRGDSGEITGVDIPAFHKVVVSLTRSLLTKRVAALATRYVKQTPLFNFEPLGTSSVAKLRGDALSQRIEIMANQYGYRHDLIQTIRASLMYGWTFEFPLSAWDREKAIRKRKRAEGMGEDMMETFITREGMVFKRPHPTRCFYDMAHPASSINTDTGCTYLGHWNIKPYREVLDNPAFFNRERIAYDTSFATQLVGYRSYFSLYSSSAPLNFPNHTNMTGVGPGANDREKLTGYYTAEDRDTTIMFTEVMERVIPRDVGLGEYPFPVWVRLVVCGDRTVVYGEVMPCVPATYAGYNQDDSKILNLSFVHEAMPWQDQLSNMLTNLLLAQKAALIKIIAMDLDVIKDPELIQEIRNMLKGEALFNRPVAIEYHGGMAADMGIDHRDAVKVVETAPLADPTLYMRSIIQILSLAERVLGTSANESAQSEPREVSATETANIAGQVSTFTAFMGQGIDEHIAAKKRQLYEAYMACGDTKFVLPVANRYTESTIRAAGFEPYTDEQEGAGLEENFAGDEPREWKITGEKVALNYDYNFHSRDGSERPSDVKSAEVLVQLLQPLSQIPGVLQAMGKKRLYELLNTIVRQSGAGVDLKFELEDGEDEAIPHGDAALDGKESIEGAFDQILAALEKLKAKDAQLEQIISQITGGVPAQPAPMMPAA